MTASQNPSPQSNVEGLKSDVEAAFRRHIEAAPYAKDILKRLAFEVVPMITAALATEGKP